MMKLGARDRAQLVVLAFRVGPRRPRPDVASTYDRRVRRRRTRSVADADDAGRVPHAGRMTNASTLHRALPRSRLGRRPHGQRHARSTAATTPRCARSTTSTVSFAPGRFTAIMGPSGSGKSTLMHCVAGLDTLTSGQVFIGDTELGTLSDRQLTLLRRERIGFVFQSFNLVPTLTAYENITLPLPLAGKSPDGEWVDAVVDTVGLRDRLAHRPSELSGGQQQRVAVARALVEPARDRLRRRADRQPRLAQRVPRCSSSCAAPSTSSARPS